MSNQMEKKIDTIIDRIEGSKWGLPYHCLRWKRNKGHSL
jgi:hypothetical protein